MPLSAIASSLAAHLPWHPAVAVPPIDSAIIWQIRLPRVVLGALVGSMLAGGGAAYQGVFRNPLADPYLLGVAAGAGLGATAVIISGASPALLPAAAFGGAAGAVALTYSLGAGAGRAGEEAGPAAPRARPRSCWPASRSRRCSPPRRPISSSHTLRRSSRSTPGYSAACRAPPGARSG